MTHQPLPTHAVRMIVPYRSEAQDVTHFATAMAGLAPDRSHPVALEIARTSQRRGFVIRATDAQGLLHVKSQLYARLPHIAFVDLSSDDDPLVLKQGETVAARELQAGAPLYLPFQSIDERSLAQAGTDPFLGILAALDAVPEHLRAICQMVLLPAPPNWSKESQRKAIEPALEPERRLQQEQLAQQRLGGKAPSIVSLLLGACLLLGLLFYRAHRELLPAWVIPAALSLLRGKLPALTPSQRLVFYGTGGVFLIGFTMFLLLVRLIRRQFLRTPIYDVKLVAQQTSQMAYRARIRLLVIGPTAPSIRSTFREMRVQRVSAAPIVETSTRCHSPAGHPSFATGMTLWRKVVRQWGRVWQGCCGLWSALQKRSAAAQERTHVLDRLVAAYRQFDHPAGNFFVPKKLRSARARRVLLHVHVTRHGTARLTTAWWRGIKRSSLYLIAPLVAQLWHPPASHDLVHLSWIEQRRMRTLPIPPLLASVTRTLPPIGISDHAGQQCTFGFPPSCLDIHMLIGGKSGEGKSSLTKALASNAMQHGGLVVIDPHGDLVQQLLHLVPAHRVDDVILLDLSDQEFAIGLNPLDSTQGRGRDKAVTDVLATLSHIWTTSWGSRMENAFEFALRTLFDANHALCQRDPYTGPAKQHTLLDVMPVLTDEAFCHALLNDITDPFILRWWKTYYDPLNEVMQRDRSDPVLSKVAKFESQIARRIVGQSLSTIHFSELIRDGKIILINLAKGIVGDDVARLLGATLLGLLQITLEEQGNLPEAERRRLPIMIDEFQVLTGVDWSSLAELRKYGAAFVLATQSLEYLRSLDTNLLPMVLANVKQYALFHMSAKDAQTIHQELDVEVEDIVHLDSYVCYLKLTYAGQRQPTFSLKLLPPPSTTNDAQVQAIQLRCRQCYGRPVEQVEEDLRIALIRSVAASSSSSPATAASTMKRETPTKYRARQDGGYRGRPSQQRKASPSADQQQTVRPMTWTETVGVTPAQGEQEDHGNA